MARIVRREVRRRGFFGWVFLVIFILFNLFMVTTTVLFVGFNSAPTSTAGTAIGVSVLLVVWALGSVITGLLALVTRGQRMYIEEHFD